MPDSVKISALPTLSAVNPNDIVPVVDEYMTQTSRATAAQIAAIGGGPPANNSVSTAKLQDNAVTAGKCAFTGPDKLFSRTASGPGAGVEISCTAYARGLLATPDGASARAYLDSLQTLTSPTFAGQVGLGRGTVGAPALAPSDDRDTGIFFPQSDALSIASNGVEIFRLQSNGQILGNAAGGIGSALRPMLSAAAWVNFNGFSAAASSIIFDRDQHWIANRYGLSGSIVGDDVTTRNYMTSLESSRGLTLTFDTVNTFSDAYGKGTYPVFNRGTYNRANYTSPYQGETHWIWNGSAWTTVSAIGRPWIGTMTLTTAINVSAIRQARGIAAITRTGTGKYTITFEQEMPDTNYCVIGTCSPNSTITPVSPVVCSVESASTTSVSIGTIQVNNTTTAYYDPTSVFLAVYR